MARTRTAAVPFTDPESTASPAAFALGRDSPVSEDSSKADSALSSSASTGSTSLGLTSSSSPGRTTARMSRPKCPRSTSRTIPTAAHAMFPATYTVATTAAAASRPAACSPRTSASTASVTATSG